MRSGGLQARSASFFFAFLGEPNNWGAPCLMIGKKDESGNLSVNPLVGYSTLIAAETAIAVRLDYLIHGDQFENTIRQCSIGDNTTSSSRACAGAIDGSRQGSENEADEQTIMS
jgi:hypothetical protein